VVFTILVLLVFNFGRDPTAVAVVDLAPSILWVTFTFAAMLALNRAFQLESRIRPSTVAPRAVSRSSIYLGKLIANLAFVPWSRALGCRYSRCSSMSASRRSSAPSLSSSRWRRSVSSRSARCSAR